MSNLNFKLILDQYLIIEQDSSSFLVYTKCTNNDRLTVGLSNGIQVWSTHVDASALERLTKMNEMETTQHCISYLHSSFTSKNVVLIKEADGQQIVNLEFGPLKVSLKLELEVSNSASEIQRLLFELAKRSTKLEEEANTREKVAKNVNNQSSSKPMPNLYLPPKLKPIDNSKARKCVPGMSVINPRSKKFKSEVKGVAFSDS